MATDLARPPAPSVPIDPETGAGILAEVNGLVDGPGVGYVKVRVAGRRVKRVYVNASKPPAQPPPPAEPTTCPRDGGTLVASGSGESRRWQCASCRYIWRREQLLKIENGSVRTTAAP